MEDTPTYEALSEKITELGKSVTLYKLAEQKYNLIFNNANDLIVYMNIKGTVIDINNKIKEIFGYTRDEVIGKNFADFDILSPDDLKKCLEYFKNAFDGKPMPFLEFESYRKDGKRIYLEVNSKLIKQDQNIIGLLNIIRDITVRKTAELKISASEKKFKSIFDNANDVIVYLAKDSTIVDINKRVEEVFGYSRDEVIGKKFTEFDFLKSEDLIITKNFFDDAIAGKVLPVYELESYQKNGTKIYLEINPRLIKENKQIVGILSIIRDITVRKEAEEQLRASEEKFKSIFENANDVIAYVDIDGTILDINYKVEDVLGYKREEVIGKKYTEFDILNPKDIQNIVDRIQGINITREDISPKLRGYKALTKDRKSIFIEVNPRLIRKHNKIKGILVIIRDISLRKEAEKELLKRKKELEIKTINLEEANVALKVLLKRRDEDTAELEEKVLTNVKELVLPFFEKLKNSGLKDKQKALAEIVEFNINDIIAPFVKGLSSKFYNLTPTEIHVANMIKQGKTTKEIADLLNMSVRTIDAHRYRIRHKLGINNQKVNLGTHLLSIK